MHDELTGKDGLACVFTIRTEGSFAADKLLAADLLGFPATEVGNTQHLPSSPQALYPAELQLDVFSPQVGTPRYHSQAQQERGPSGLHAFERETVLF